MAAIGDMRHYLTLQRRVRVADGAGGFVETWEAVESNPQVFAAIETLSGRETLVAGQLRPAATHRMTTRYRADITTDMRLSSGTVHYDILAVLDRDNRKIFLELLTATGL